VIEIDEPAVGRERASVARGNRGVGEFEAEERQAEAAAAAIAAA
jgi:hypothetical protein